MAAQVPLQQMYCTHCTYGTSALEQRKGQGADRVLGYSARASSLTKNELARYYRAVERFTYYHLPSDTPAEKKDAHFSAHDAPRRLIFHPSVAAFQLAAQVSYRPVDTAGRPGSYFAHVLVAPRRRQESPWSIFEALNLWSSEKWVLDDDPEKGFELSKLNGIRDMLPKSGKVVNEDIFRKFLSEPAGGHFPSELITDRWRQMEAVDRRRHFVTALTKYLEIARKGRRDSLLLVIEPAMSVLFFYGIARLLPKPLREGLSFSTYEPAAERLCTTLAATHFSDSQNDLKPELYQRGTVFNTFLTKSSPSRNNGGAFDDVVRRIETDWEEAWREIREMLSFENEACKNVAELDQLSEAASFVRSLLCTASEAGKQPVPPWEKSSRRVSLQKTYAHRVVRQRLKGPVDKAMLASLIQSPERVLAVLDLLKIGQAPAEHQPTLNYLAARLPEKAFPGLLSSGNVPPDYQVKALRHFVLRGKGLPEGCEPLWNDMLKQTPDGRKQLLLGRLFRKLEAKTMDQVGHHVAPADRVPFFLCVFENSQVTPDDAELSKREEILRSLLKLLNDKQFRVLMHNLEYCGLTPTFAEALGGRFGKLVDSLHQEPDEFKERVELLGEHEHHLSAESSKQLDAWKKIKTRLVNAQHTANRKRSPLKLLQNRPAVDSDELEKEIVQQLEHALPEDDRRQLANMRRKEGQRNVQLMGADVRERSRELAECIQRIAQSLGVDEGLLSNQFAENMARYFFGRRWPSPQPKSHQAKKKPGPGKAKTTSQKKSPLVSLVKTGTLSLLLVVAVCVAWKWWRPSENEVATGGSGNQTATSPETAGGGSEATDPAGSNAEHRSEENSQHDPGQTRDSVSEGEVSEDDGGNNADDSSGDDQTTRQPGPHRQPPAGTNAEHRSGGSTQQVSGQIPAAVSEDEDSENNGENNSDDSSGDNLSPLLTQESVPAQPHLAKQPFESLPSTITEGRETIKVELFNLQNSNYSIRHVHGISFLTSAESNITVEPKQVPTIKTRLELVAKYADPKKPIGNIATFILSSSALKCEIEPSDKDKVRSLQERVRFCVVELRDEEEDKSIYVALEKTRPILRKLENGTATIPWSKQVPNSGKPAAYNQLYVHRGQLLGEQVPLYDFGSNKGKDITQQSQSLPIRSADENTPIPNVQMSLKAMRGGIELSVKRPANKEELEKEIEHFTNNLETTKDHHITEITDLNETLLALDWLVNQMNLSERDCPRSPFLVPVDRLDKTEGSLRKKVEYLVEVYGVRRSQQNLFYYSNKGNKGSINLEIIDQRRVAFKDWVNRSVRAPAKRKQKELEEKLSVIDKSIEEWKNIINNSKQVRVEISRQVDQVDSTSGPIRVFITGPPNQ